MAPRSSKIGRIRAYFKEADLDEADVVLQLVTKDVAERHSVTSQPALPFHKKVRKPRAKKSNAEPADHHTESVVQAHEQAAQA